MGLNKISNSLRLTFTFQIPPFHIKVFVVGDLDIILKLIAPTVTQNVKRLQAAGI